MVFDGSLMIDVHYIFDLNEKQKITLHTLKEDIYTTELFNQFQ